MRATTILSITAALWVGSWAADTPAVADVKLEGWTNRGSGCARGSVAVSVEEYLGGDPCTTIRIVYEGMNPSLGSSGQTDAEEKDEGEVADMADDDDMSCRVRIAADHPEGWEYAVFGMYWSGHGTADEGVSLAVSSTVTSHGEPAPLAKMGGGGTWDTGVSFGLSDVVWPDERVWSGCDGEHEVDLTVEDRAVLSGEAGLFAQVNDVKDPASYMTQDIYIVWRKCASTSDEADD